MAEWRNGRRARLKIVLGLHPVRVRLSPWPQIDNFENSDIIHGMKNEHFQEPGTKYFNRSLSGCSRTEHTLNGDEWKEVKTIADDPSNPDSEFLTTLLELNSTMGEEEGEHKVMFLDGKHDGIRDRWLEIIKKQTNIKIEKVVNHQL